MKKAIESMLEGDSVDTNRIVHNLILNPTTLKAKDVLQPETKEGLRFLSPKLKF